MNRYIVEVRDGLASEFADEIQDVTVERLLPQVGVVIVSGAPNDADALRRDPRVARVTLDVEVSPDGFTTQQVGADRFHLDRIAQRRLPLDGTFRYRQGGEGVRVYIVDIGLRGTHVEYAALVDTAVGYSVVDGAPYTSTGVHGTASASVVAGATVGVARGVQIVSVKVGESSSSLANLIEGLDWIAANHPADTPGVVNFPWGLNDQPTLDAAAQDVIDAGLVFVTSAGNDSLNAATVSPNRVSDVLCVAAADIDDNHITRSNFGPVVDLYAPSDGFLAASNDGDSSYAAVSDGTSWSCPIVAGIAAQVLSGMPTLAPQDVNGIIVEQATPGALDGVPAETPNLLAYSLTTVDGGGTLPSYVWTGDHWAPVDHPVALDGPDAGGSVAVDDDGTEVTAAASRLNFGDNLTVTNDGGGAVTIDALGGGVGGAGTFCDVFGDGVETTIDVEHGLGTSCVQVGVVEVASGDALVHGTDYTWLILDDDTVRLVFSSAPDTDDARVVVLASGGEAEPRWETLYDDALTNVSEIDVTLPDDFRYLRAVTFGVVPSGNTAAIGVQLNGDTGNNYHTQRTDFTTSATIQQSSPRSNFPATRAIASASSQLEHDWNIAKPVATRSARCNVHGGWGNTSGISTDLSHSQWVNTADLLTRFRVFINAGTASTLPFFSLLLEGRR